MDSSEVKELMKVLGKRADAEGIDRLSDEERNVLVPYWARGVIGNGGFRYFFAGSHDLEDVARRLRVLGCDSAAEACEQVARAVFPRGVRAESQDREEILNGVDWDRFAPQESVVYQLKWPALTEAIGRYIERNPGAFRS